MVAGETEVCQDHENIYNTADNSGSAYNWEVAGGNITGGAGTNEITVLWTNIGDGYVLVTEISANSCEGTSDTLHVLIDECTGIEETGLQEVKLYPNPASDIVTLSFIANTALDYQLELFNQFGQKVYFEKAKHLGGKASHQIPTGNLNRGLYYLKITTSTNQFHQSKLEIIN